jgi:hypothetical protein
LEEHLNYTNDQWTKYFDIDYRYDSTSKINFVGTLYKKNIYYDKNGNINCLEWKDFENSHQVVRLDSFYYNEKNLLTDEFTIQIYYELNGLDTVIYRRDGSCSYIYDEQDRIIRELGGGGNAYNHYNSEGLLDSVFDNKDTVVIKYNENKQRVYVRVEWNFNDYDKIICVDSMFYENNKLTGHIEMFKQPELSDFYYSLKEYWEFDDNQRIANKTAIDFNRGVIQSKNKEYFTYNDAGKKVESMRQIFNYQDSTWYNKLRYQFKYDEYWNLIDSTEQVYKNDNWVDNLKHVYTYNKILSINENKFNIFKINNFPNPVSDETLITFHIPDSDFLTLDLFDSRGELVYLINRNHYYEKGINNISLNFSELPTGIYFLKFSGKKFNANHKIIVYR